MRRRLTAGNVKSDVTDEEEETEELREEDADELMDDALLLDELDDPYWPASARRY